MDISSMYDINRIVISLEVALQIDGQDYAEKDVSVIIDNVKKRIIRQYQVDLTSCKIFDDDLTIGRSRNSAVLFIENVASLHGQLCGYLQIVRYTGEVKIKPVNVNYLGFVEKSLMSVFQLAMRKKTVPALKDAMEAVKIKVGSINNCLEKKMFLIMIVAYELGFYEVMAAVAEILYHGGKV